MCTLGGWLRAKSAVLRPLRHSTVFQENGNNRIFQHHQSPITYKREECFPLEHYQSMNSSKMNDWENLIMSRCTPSISVFGKNNKQYLKAVTTFPQPSTNQFYKVARVGSDLQSRLLNNSILQCINEKSPSTSGNQQGPSAEQLHFIYEKLSKTLPELFFGYHDYSIYDLNLIFINNIKGTRTQGLNSYIRQVAILRAVGHLRFGYVKFEILKITKREKDATVIVRWRIRGIGGIKALLLVWKYRLWRMRENLSERETWYDGLSTFYVGTDGKIIKHVADKMMPDEENIVDEIIPKGTIAPKLA